MSNIYERRFSIPEDPDQERNANEELRKDQWNKIVEDSFEKGMEAPPVDSIDDFGMDAIAATLVERLEKEFPEDIDEIIEYLETRVDFNPERQEMADEAIKILKTNQVNRGEAPDRRSAARAA